MVNINPPSPIRFRKVSFSKTYPFMRGSSLKTIPKSRSRMNFAPKKPKTAAKTCKNPLKLNKNELFSCEINKLPKRAIPIKLIAKRINVNGWALSFCLPATIKYRLDSGNCKNVLKLSWYKYAAKAKSTLQPITMAISQLSGWNSLKLWSTICTR